MWWTSIRVARRRAFPQQRMGAVVEGTHNRGPAMGKKIRLTRDGVDYEGRWSVDNGLITVVLEEVGSEITQLAGQKEDPSELAASILNELIDEHLRRQYRQSRSMLE